MRFTKKKLQRIALIAIAIFAIVLVSMACDTLMGESDGESREDRDEQTSGDGDGETTEASDEQTSGDGDGETIEASDEQTSDDDDPETVEQTEEPETLVCELVCNIDSEQYGFDISCESGLVTSTMNNSTRFTYDSNGSIESITVDLDQELEYENSGNTYLIEGTIIVNQSTNRISEDITATGGLFGDTTQTCDN